MKRLAFFLLLALVIFILPPSSKAQGIAQNGEHIKQYNVKIIIRESGQISVSEEIVYDFGAQARHGIFRNIPNKKTNKDGKNYSMKINVLSVLNSKGEPYPFLERDKGGEIVLKIGDPDKTITGVHTYNIDYIVDGALTYFSDHDELYWNAIGSQWDVPINSARVEVVLPGTIRDIERRVQFACFTGIKDSTEQSCIIERQGRSVVYTSTKTFSAREGFTIVSGFPKGLVAVLKPTPIITFADTFFGKVVIIVGVVLVLLWYLIYPIWIGIKWYKYGRDPDVGPSVKAYFDPPTTRYGRVLTPAETGALLDEVVDMRDIMASVIDMARRGYFTIVEKKKGDYLLVKNVKQKEELVKPTLLGFESKLLSGIFKKKSEVRIKDIKLYSTIRDVEKRLYQRLVDDNFFPKNPNSIRNYYSILAFFSIFTANIPLLISSLVFGRAMPRKTLHGAREAKKAGALKNFIKSQKRHFEFIQKYRPDFQLSKQFLFEKFLPFAVAFGIEKQWARRFEGVSLKEPSWYHSSRGGRFNSVLFVSSLSSTFVSFTSSATPSRSSSGFSSGFSGGGFSGGGGGGGSW